MVQANYDGVQDIYNGSGRCKMMGIEKNSDIDEMLNMKNERFGKI